MPRSKSKRSTYIPPKRSKPPPSPTWVPIFGGALIALGVLVIILNYVDVGLLPGGNYKIFVGFGLMAVGLAVLSQWR